MPITSISDAPDAGDFDPDWRLPIAKPGNSNPFSTDARTLNGVPNPEISFTGTAGTVWAFLISKGAMVLGESFATGAMAKWLGADDQHLVESIDFGTVQIIDGDFGPYLPACLSITLDNLKFVTGDLNLSRVALDMITLSLPELVSVRGLIVPYYVVTLEVPQLKLISNSLGNINSVEHLSMPLLEYVGEATIEFMGMVSLSMPALFQAVTLAFSSSAMIAVDLSSLTLVSDGLDLRFSTLGSLSLPSLTTVYGPSNFQLNSGTNLSMPVLSELSVESTVNFIMDNMTEFELPELFQMGSVTIRGDNLINISFPLLQVVGAWGSEEPIPMPSLVTLNLPGLQACSGDFGVVGAALSEASVDGVLIALATIVDYNDHLVDLSGGTSSAPSATGLIAKATLEGRGCTVTVN